MKKHFLYLTDYYYPSPTSIGICGDAVIRKLIEDGNKVDVVCFGDKTRKDEKIILPDLRLFHVKDRIWEIMRRSNKGFVSKTGNIICRISQLLTMHFFPMSSFSVPIRYLRVVKELYKKNGYEEIVSSYAPFEACWAAYRLAMKKREIRWSIYILDTFTNRGASKFFSEKWNDSHGWRWEKQFFFRADKIINLRCHETHHKQNRYDAYRDKMFFVDIPLFDPAKFENVKVQPHEEELRFVYTGRIDSHWYSPKRICELFDKLSKGKNWKLHFFGNSGDCTAYLDEMNRLTNGKIVREGLVSRERVKEELKGADVLVSFCYMDSDKIQSKIFDYMSTGAKILHLTDFTARDSARDYYSCYNNALVLDDADWRDGKDLTQICSFLEDGKRIPIDELKNLFKDNRPQTTAEILEG